MTNKYQSFKHEFTARHQDRAPISIKFQLIVFCLLMFIVGFALGYYLSAAQSSAVVSALTK